MEQIAKSNNFAVELLQSGNYHEACLCLERALRGLLAETRQFETCDDFESNVSPKCENEENQIRGQNTRQKGTDRQGTVKVARIMLFDTFHARSQLRFSISSNSNNIAQKGSSLSTMNTSHLFTSGIKLDFVLIRQAEEEKFALGTGIVNIILASMSAAILFNMALLNQLRGETLLVRGREWSPQGCDESPSKFFECAHRLYMKVEQTLCSMTVNPLFHNECFHVPDSSMQPIIEFLYLATWNNEGHLALGIANYENSRRCFNNLYDLSRVILGRTPSGPFHFEAKLQATVFHNGNSHSLSENFPSDITETVDAPGDKEESTFSSLSLYAFFFMINATCFQNTGHHAVAA